MNPKPTASKFSHSLGQCKNPKKASTLVLVAAVISLAPIQAFATMSTFTLAHPMSSGAFSLGFEPVFSFTSSAAIEANFRYVQGITDLISVGGVVGTGSGDLQFRLGGTGGFDFFPDVEGQPGIGVNAQVTFFKISTGGMLEVGGAPYIHKAFKINTKGALNNTEVEPYFSIPLAIQFDGNGTYRLSAAASVGAFYKVAESLRVTSEFGVAIVNSQSYIALGVAYFH